MIELPASTLLCFLVVVFLFYWRTRTRLPPGPKGWPIIGNLLDIPKQYEWFYYSDLGEKYGPVSSVTVLGKPIVILDTLEASKDVMERNSAKCSGRPTLPFAGQMVGWDQQLIMSPYNKHFKLMRKMAHNFLGTRVAAQKYEPVQEAEAFQFASCMAKDSEHFEHHLRTSVGAMVLRMSHGYLVRRDSLDPLTTLIEQSAQDFYVITRPGRWLVDLFPSLKSVPGWLPGAGFKSAAEVYRKRNFEQTDAPYRFVLEAMAKKTALPSMVSDALEQGSLNPDEVYALKHVSSAMYGGALDTIIATVSSFILLMVLHPDVQKRVQNELDSVVGSHRVPNFRDRPNLPFFAAVQKEVTRYHPIGPLGIPHEASDSFHYGEYTIPRGAIVISNIWKIAHDPGNYDDPMLFKPERFLSGEDILDPEQYIYGFGRRICPGIEIAHSTVFIVMVTCLALFEITKAKDQDGQEIPVEEEFVSGTVCHPKPFRCSFRLRSTESTTLLQEQPLQSN